MIASGIEETDCIHVPLTLCLRYPHIHTHTHTHTHTHIYIYIYIYILQSMYGRENSRKLPTIIAMKVLKYLMFVGTRKLGSLLDKSQFSLFNNCLLIYSFIYLNFILFSYLLINKFSMVQLSFSRKYPNYPFR